MYRVVVVVVVDMLVLVAVDAWPKTTLVLVITLSTVLVSLTVFTARFSLEADTAAKTARSEKRAESFIGLSGINKCGDQGAVISGGSLRIQRRSQLRVLIARFKLSGRLKE